MARQAVRDLDAGEARQLARHALALSTAAEIEQYLFDSLAETGIRNRGRD
jgi:hypothetical protein